MAQQTISSTTQTYLDIHDISNDLVIMKNGTTSLVLSVDAMNFGLLAEEEQDSIIYAYAGLLNSLNYPIQVIVRSQTKDVTSYLQKLKDQEDKATDRHNQLRIRRYREFVSNLIHERNVLDKKFYVVIPAAPLELGLLPVQSVVPGQKEFDVSTVERSVLLEKAKNILEPKRDHLIAQFARIGLYSYQLTTQEIIQLFYISYNPEAAEGQHIADSNSYNTPLVKASFEGVPMFSQQPTDQAQQPPAAAPQASATEPTTATAPTAAQQPAAPTPAPAQPAAGNLGETPMNVPPAAPGSPAPAETPSPTATPTAPTSQPTPTTGEGGVPVETGSISTPMAEPAAVPQTASPQPAATPLSVETTPTATPAAGGDDAAQMQNEINKTVGQIDPTPTAQDAPAANQSSDQKSENLPEI